MMSEKLVELEEMEFGDLRKLVDYCLGNKDSLKSHNLRLVTKNKMELNEYINILEKKRKPSKIPKFESEFITVDHIAKSLKESLARKEREREEMENRISLLIKQISVRSEKVRKNEEKLAGENLKLSRVQYDISKDYKMSRSKESRRYQVQHQQTNFEEEKNRRLKKVKLIENKIFVDKKELSKLIKLSDEVERKYASLTSEIENLIAKINSKNYEDEIIAKQDLVDKNLNKKIREYKKLYPSNLVKYKSSLAAKIINGLRSDLANLDYVKPKMIELKWELLPAGEMPFDQVEKYLKKISKLPSDEFDYEKIKKILTLNIDKIYCGSDNFEGYLVFYFEKMKIAILDSPKTGNAIYIFTENWKHLSQLTKSELLNYHTEKITRIIHKGDWFERLKLYLDTHKTNSKSNLE